MFELNKLKLTPEGLASLANADAGGFLVNPKSFRVGDGQAAPTEALSELQGNEIDKGVIHYVEVRDKTTSEFTIELSAESGSLAGVRITEILIYSDDNTPLGYAYLDPAYTKISGRSSRIQILLHSTEADLTNLNVTLSEYGSIPSVPSVEDLPNPVDSLSNAISVLTMNSNSVGDRSPGIACSYGAGKNRWGFVSHDLIFDEVLGDKFVSPVELDFSSVKEELELSSGDELIGQIVTGAGAGLVRYMKVSGESLTLENAFTDCDSNSHLAVWKRQSGSSTSACPWPPKSDNIPEDWVLTRGSGACPEFKPPRNSVSSNTRLYKTPSKLSVKTLATVGTRSDRRYALDNAIEDARYVRMNMSGISNHRTGFTLDRNVVEIFESFPENLDLEFKYFDREPSSGTRLLVRTTSAVGDGVTKRFQLGGDVSKPSEVIVFVDTSEQMLTAYNVEDGWLVFNEAPDSGVDIEINALTYEQREGYSTEIIVTQVEIGTPTNIIKLPVIPETKDQVFVSANGLSISKKYYGIADDNIVLTSNLDSGQEIEVMVFQNVLALGQEGDDLPGVMTGALTHASGIDILRHNLPPVRIPAPKFVLEPGSGIKVEGTFPNFKIISTIGDKVAKDKFKTLSAHKQLEDSETLILTKRIEFKGDIAVNVAANFGAKLGPGFKVDTGAEAIEYVVGVRSPTIEEADFGREVEGSGEAGFTYLREGSSAFAHANVSQSMSYNIRRANNPAGYVEVIAKVRIINAKVNAGAFLMSSLNITVLPDL
tara:strand:- start:2415 stop:4715 length:2301 start_codon:yes stop_codon:yes gene_type:complete